MKTNFTKRRLILGLIVGAIALMTLISLCIPLLAVEDMEISECGFTLLRFTSEEIRLDDVIAIIIGIYSVFHLIFALTAIVFAVLTIFIFSNRAVKKLWLGFSITCLVFAFLYMLIGVILASEFKYFRIGSYSDGYYFDTYTLSYLAFILVALLFAAFMVCNVLIKEKTVKNEELNEELTIEDVVPKTSNSVVAAKSADSTLERNRAITESLKMYKELLDSGAITQEEFDNKKREILK